MSVHRSILFTSHTHHADPCIFNIRFFNAMEMYSRAYVSFQQEGLDEEVEWVKKRVEKIAFKPVCLVPKTSSSEDIIRFDHVAILLAQQERAATGDANSNTGISSNVSLDAGTKLTLSSHPGMALCLSDRSTKYPGWDFNNLCIGPVESALSVKYEEGRFVACHGGKSCLVSTLDVLFSFAWIESADL